MEEESRQDLRSAKGQAISDEPRQRVSLVSVQGEQGRAVPRGVNIEQMIHETYAELCRAVKQAADIERESGELRARTAVLAFRLNLLLKRFT